MRDKAGSQWTILIETEGDEFVVCPEHSREVLDHEIVMRGKAAEPWKHSVTCLRVANHRNERLLPDKTWTRGFKVTVGEIVLVAATCGIEVSEYVGGVKSVLAKATGIRKREIKSVRLVIGIDLSAETSSTADCMEVCP